ncbi:MAG: M28 family peptidase [candidate division Zixibacteria bacterium]|nr:M28 family peptidase [candidate division Zixibacteria bacterium]
MYKSFFALLLCVVGLAAAAGSADLYKVLVTSSEDALRLNEAGVEPVAPIFGGYLVLTDPSTRAGLEDAGIKMTLITSDVSMEELAIDLRLDMKNIGEFQTAYEEGRFRVYRVDRSLWKSAADLSVMPVKSDNLKIEYQPSPVFDKGRLDMIDLQGLIAQVSQDSLYSYTSTLQAFGDRYYGTSSNRLSRDWLAGKFASFGYDSIVIDSFVYSSVQCQNVLAVKIGTILPEHYIVVGAHRDAVSGSPGADDNGSGSAAVLEIARILKDIDTDLTFVFALFDSEEQGLNGSDHYAHEAAARGDSIVYMLDMDMIAAEGNSTQANLYYGSVMTYTELCQQLADSLLGITAVFSGSSGGSDHYPFLSHGYQATFLQEYNFSTVYHSYHDSTTHMNFPYFAEMTRVGLATVYTVSQKYVPGPQVKFVYPEGVPSEVIPGNETSFPVVVSGLYDGVPVPGSGRMYYSLIHGATVETAMSEQPANQYQAVLPVLACGDSLAFYFSAEEVDSGIFYDPEPTDPFIAIPVTGDSVIFTDNFEQDLGWTTTGAWQRGSPTGGGGSYGGPDPVGGHNSTNCYGYNLAGDYTNSMTEMPLTSPAIDCQGVIGVHLKFWRWLGVEKPLYDHARVQVSSDGTAWTTVWENTVTIADSSWKLQEVDISAFADNQPTVYLRWTMGPTDGSWAFCGWNIDDVEVGGHVCNATLMIITASLPDWTAGHPYSQQLHVSGGVGPYTWIDKSGSLSGTGLTLSAAGLLSGVPASPGPISFTAEVSDQGSGSADKDYDFTINPALVITTSSLPNGNPGEPYSHQLASTGGTGTVTWTDKNGALVGTGLAMFSSGSVNGTPVATGPIDFTARAVDAAGASAEKLLAFSINGSYVCGDANGNGAVNVADAVFIISYIFREGPAPSPLEGGDANCDDVVNVGDAIYIVSYVFRGGPAPCCP